MSEPVVLLEKLVKETPCMSELTSCLTDQALPNYVLGMEERGQNRGLSWSCMPQLGWTGVTGLLHSLPNITKLILTGPCRQ